MSWAEYKSEIQSFLESDFKQFEVVVMPDFFLDRLISLSWTVSEFSGLIANVAKRNGGSIDGIPQNDLRGGNAINVASTLSSLGAKVTPIVCTSQLGLRQIKYHFRKNLIDTSHIKICSKASITTALEFKRNNDKTNVMLRDLGSLADFGQANLNESDYAVIDSADYVCVFNWAGTLNFGTTLAQMVFDRTKNRGKGKTYYDTADPNPNAKSIPDLMENILKTNKVDILSLNENEAITYASMLDDSLKQKKGSLSFSDLAMEAARILAKYLPTRIDLHTTHFSATLKGNREVIVPTFKVKVLRTTGAGDSWNAGNILADNNELSDGCRLMLANAVAASYLSNEDGLHPTKTTLLTFLSDNV
jgi:sugar/nucleoside kinase (ribokinase family)